MRSEINDALKTAMKAGDKPRVGVLRLINSAIKDRDVAGRVDGKPEASDEDILQALAKMIKQREESARLFDEGGRPELATNERAEITVIREFMPQQISGAELEAAVDAAIAETGAAGIKDMGKVIALLRSRHAGGMDFGAASGVVKARLSA